MRSWVEFGTDGTEDFETALSGLERLSGLIPSKVQDTIEDELSTLAGRAKAKLLSEGTHGDKHTGLRARIAAGISVVRDSGGAEIRVTVQEEDMRSIPWGLDSESSGWRHPVFGRANSWVNQHGNISWWHETMQQAKPTLDRKLPETIDDAVKEAFNR